jgi:hypothetical protein
MVRVPPPGRRSTSRQTPEGVEVSIPPRRNLFLLLFLFTWLIGWGFGEVMVVRELLFGGGNAPDLFLLAWLSMWTIAGGAGIYAWLRMVAGREVVLLGGGVLAITDEVLSVGRSKEYDLAHIKNIRVEPPTLFPMDMSGALRFWGIGGGPIAFDYGSKTVRFGAGLDEAEARQVIQDLRDHHPFREAHSR